jgi:hypothetical protein
MGDAQRERELMPPIIKELYVEYTRARNDYVRFFGRSTTIQDVHRDTVSDTTIVAYIRA